MLTIINKILIRRIRECNLSKRFSAIANARTAIETNEYIKMVVATVKTHWVKIGSSQKEEKNRYIRR